MFELILLLLLLLFIDIIDIILSFENSRLTR